MTGSRLQTQKPKILIWGESRLGSGHTRIHSELTHALIKNGWDVHVMTGSAFVDKFDFGIATVTRLPGQILKDPAGNQGNLDNYVTPNGKHPERDLAWQSKRACLMADVYQQVQPDVVVTEMWPYDHVYSDAELIPLLDAIKKDPRNPPPKLYSLVRDIMLPTNSVRHPLAKEHFHDGSIFVRGDKDFIPLEKSLGDLPEDVASLFHYIGYFASPPNHPTQIPEPEREVLVTSGGLMLEESRIMFRASIAARKNSTLKNHTWRIFVPDSCPGTEFAELQQLAARECSEGKIVVERNCPRFSERIADARLLICHGGNTVIEGVCAKVPILIVPMEATNTNYEQELRATIFKEKGLVEIAKIPEVNDTQTFVDKINQAAALSCQDFLIQCNGAQNMATIITQQYQFQHSGKKHTSSLTNRLSSVTSPVSNKQRL